MLRESLASSLIFDWKPNWFLSRKLFLCDKSSFGVSILRGLWCHSVYLFHLFCFSVLVFFEGQHWCSWICIWNDLNQAFMAWIASCCIRAWIRRAVWKYILQLGAVSSFSFFSFFRKWEVIFHLILVCLFLIVCFLCVFSFNHAYVFDIPIFLLNLELIRS